MSNKEDKKYPILNLIKLFDLDVVNKEYADLKRFTTSPSIHRTGLELTGAYDISHTSANIIGWGTKERNWLTSLSKEKAKKAIQLVITDLTPLILLSQTFNGEISDIVIEVASKRNVAVVKTSQHLATLRTTIGTELIRYFAAEKSVHGSLVVINGVGVLIIGKSGVGKSEAVLELIQNNHSFISDDTVILKQIGKEFIGSGAEITKGFLEARGIGLINIPYIYGERLVKSFANVELVVELILQDEVKNIDRLGIKNLSYKVLDGEIPKMQIPVNQGRSVASLIEAATNVFVARKDGLDPIKEMNKRRGENE